MIHLEPVVFTGRVFLKGKQWGDDYDAVFTVQRMGCVAYISACHGKIDKRAVMDLGDELEELGMTEMRWLRHGRDK